MKIKSLLIRNFRSIKEIYLEIQPFFARARSEVNLDLYLGKIPLVVKLIAVYLTSIVSFFMTDLMVLFGIVAGGINPIAFILYIVMRAVFGYLVSRFVLGSKESDDFRRELVLATIIFGVPLMSFIEVLRILFGISINIPLPPYVSIMQATLIIALLYEFPRLILLIVIKRARALKTCFDRKDWPYPTSKGIIKTGLGRGRDKEMVLDTLCFITEISQNDYNILDYSIDQIQNNKVPELFKLFDNIRSVGVKTASLFIRDTVAFYGLESSTFVHDKHSQPIDTWVRQVCNKLNIVANNDEDLVNKIVQECKFAGVSPIKFNQGLWYLGSHSLELIFKGFTF